MTDDSLLAELAEEFTSEMHAGKPGDIEEYARRYPELAERIRELFPTLMMLEGMAAAGEANMEVPEIRKYAMESDVQIYGIWEERGPLSPNVIPNLANITGGRGYFPRHFKELDYYIDLICAELRTQYLLCYTPTNNKHNGTLRKIKIKLDPPPKLPKLIIHARKERYVPKN